MTLRQRFAMHARLQGGYMYVHTIFDDETGRDVGTVTSTKYRKMRQEERLYAIGDRTFDSVGDFRKAYEQQRRDEEFDAAAPNDARS